MQKHLFSSKNFLQRPIRHAECLFCIVFHADRSIFFKTSESGKVCEMRFEAQESVIAHLVEGGEDPVYVSVSGAGWDDSSVGGFGVFDVNVVESKLIN